MSNRKSYHRKQYIIDKKFQFKATFTIIGFILVIIAILITLMLINVIDVNEKIKNIIKIEDNIVSVLTTPNPKLSSKDQKFSIQMAQNHDKNIKTVNQMIQYNMILIWIIVAVVFLQGFILFFVLIRQTHRIAGPIYVMSQYMKEIIAGKIPKNVRKLRDSDLLQDFYYLFIEMIDTLNAKNKTKKKK